MFRSLLFLAAFALVMNDAPGFSQQSAFAQPPVPAVSTGLVVVELFTSQGCSSCPPADQLLAKIEATENKRQRPIYALSFHVDYWNSLGWKDPYSSRQFTLRQRQYSTAFGSRSIYTPQMIVNGKTEFVGSRHKDAQQAIEAARLTPATSTIQLKAELAGDQRSVEVEYVVSGHTPDAAIHIALVQKKGTNKVPRGENANRELVHVQIVRRFKTVSLDDDHRKNRGKLSLKLPADLAAQKASVVAYVQNLRSMQISGASAASF